MNHEMATNSKTNFRDIDTFLIGVVTHINLKQLECITIEPLVKTSH